MGFSSMSNWTFNTIVIFSFPLLQGMFGIEYTFALYAAICFLGLIYTYFYMPETKNLSLEQIENYVMAGKPLRFLGREKEGLIASYKKSRAQRDAKQREQIVQKITKTLGSDGNTKKVITNQGVKKFTTTTDPR